MSDEIKKMFNAFAKACDILNKIADDRIIASNGVFMWQIEGSLSITTLHQKIEKDMIPFLTRRYDLNVSAVLFMAKYFEIEDIRFTDDGIKLSFSGSITPEALLDAKVEAVFMIINKSDTGQYVLNLNWIDSEDSEYIRICEILDRIGTSADFDKSIMITDLNKTELMKGSKPVDIDQDGFRVRIAKSVFQSINANDTITLRCSPYINTDAIFLCTATVSKDHCQVINVFNALHI
jgi:hypothetical protein